MKRAMYVIITVLFMVTTTTNVFANSICFSVNSNTPSHQSIQGVKIDLYYTDNGRLFGTYYTGSDGCLKYDDLNINGKKCFIVKWFKEGFKTPSNRYNPNNEFRMDENMCFEPGFIGVVSSIITIDRY